MKKSLSDFFTNPKIKEKINSEQFDLSRILIKKRLELDFSLEKMAKITDFDEGYYLKMEYGDLDVPLSDFNMAIEKIEHYNDKLSQNHYNVKETFYTDGSDDVSFNSQSKSGNFNPEPGNIELEAA